MASIDWKKELNRMLDVIGKESAVSLDKINQQFGVSGLPFNDAFRENVRTMVNARLDSSFAQIAMKQWDVHQPNAVQNRCSSANASNGSQLGLDSQKTARKPRSTRHFAMNIYVRDLRGKRMELMVNSSDTVEILKEKIEEREGIPADQQRLIFKQLNSEIQLKDEHTLSDYHIQNGTTLDLVLRLCGC